MVVWSATGPRAAVSRRALMWVHFIPMLSWMWFAASSFLAVLMKYLAGFPPPHTVTILWPSRWSCFSVSAYFLYVVWFSWIYGSTFFPVSRLPPRLMASFIVCIVVLGGLGFSG